MRIMGLDFGDKTVGVALSDPLFLNARPKEIIFESIPRNATGKIEKNVLRKKYGTENLVAKETTF